MIILKKRAIKRYGWKRQIPDPRDRRMKVAAPATLKRLPLTVDDRHSVFQTSVLDQGKLGSCVGHGVGDTVQWELRKHKLPNFLPSRLGIYYGAREIEGTVNEDAGCEIRDAIKVVAKQGAGNEDLWPYVINRFDVRPTDAYYAEALKHTAIEYEAVEQSELEIKRAIASGFPVIFGFSVFESFESDKVANTGVVPLPKMSEEFLGGHCVKVGGYTKTRVRPKNSWGPMWGDNGFFTLPLDYILNPDLAGDFWIIKAVL
jgi:C1A family cysteine protease